MHLKKSVLYQNSLNKHSYGYGNQIWFVHPEADKTSSKNKANLHFLKDSKDSFEIKGMKVETKKKRK